MKRNVLVFGSVSAAILMIWVIFIAVMCCNYPNFEGNMWLGYGSMIVAFSFIFVAIKNFRDKYNDGAVGFGKAFQIGLYIALIASTMYVLTWLVDFYYFIPDFMDKYVAHVLTQAKEHGATVAEIAQKKADMAGYIQMYKSPFGVIVLTYLEVLPIGLIMAVIAALILKRKPNAGQEIPVAG